MRAVFFAFLLFPYVAFAQADDFQARLGLAKQMHEFRSSADQVDSAIEAVSLRLPESERDDFLKAMKEALNYKAVERVSVDAMAEIFTIQELEAMVGYYSQPEARSASDKYEEYYARLGPEIIKMIDAAMMRVRLGE